MEVGGHGNAKAACSSDPSLAWWLGGGMRHKLELPGHSGRRRGQQSFEPVENVDGDRRNNDGVGDNEGGWVDAVRG